MAVRLAQLVSLTFMHFTLVDAPPTTLTTWAYTVPLPDGILEKLATTVPEQLLPMVLGKQAVCWTSVALIVKALALKGIAAANPTITKTFRERISRLQ